MRSMKLGLSHNCQQHYLWRDAKADGKKADADSGGYEKVVPILEEMASEILSRESRRRDGRTYEGDINLPTVRVGREQERHGLRNVWENIGIVRQRDDR
jgi:hypothetical protein